MQLTILENHVVCFLECFLSWTFPYLILLQCQNTIYIMKDMGYIVVIYFLYGIRSSKLTSFSEKFRVGDNILVKYWTVKCKTGSQFSIFRIFLFSVCSLYFIVKKSSCFRFIWKPTYRINTNYVITLHPINALDITAVQNFRVKIFRDFFSDILKRKQQFFRRPFSFFSN